MLNEHLHRQLIALAIGVAEAPLGATLQPRGAEAIVLEQVGRMPGAFLCAPGSSAMRRPPPPPRRGGERQRKDADPVAGTRPDRLRRPPGQAPVAQPQVDRDPEETATLNSAMTGPRNLDVRFRLVPASAPDPGRLAGGGAAHGARVPRRSPAGFCAFQDVLPDARQRDAARGALQKLRAQQFFQVLQAAGDLRGGTGRAPPRRG